MSDVEAKFIIKTRVRELAKAQGKILSRAFVSLVDKEVEEMVLLACRLIGDKKVVPAKDIKEYRDLINKFAPNR